MTRYIF